MLFVRADGNAKIGAGHLMRCLTIVEAYAELRGTKDDVWFVCADELSAAVAREHGFAAKVLGTDYRDMESELPLWSKQICGGEGKSALTILVDSYYVTENYLRSLQSYGKVVLLDDMQQRAFPVDVVVNYNVFAEKEKYQELYRNTDTRLCVGGEYVPVRPQFLQVEYVLSDRVKNVLITTGGGDADNIAGAILETIYTPETEYHLVIGKFNPHRQVLEEKATQCHNVHLHMDVKDMAGLMRQCDLAITAGGTTIYELAAIGIPFICFSYAENQEALTSFLGEREIAYFAGAYHKEADKVLKRMDAMVTELCEDFAKRRECTRQEKELSDGKGAKRLAKMLCAGETSALQ